MRHCFPTERFLTIRWVEMLHEPRQITRWSTWPSPLQAKLQIWLHDGCLKAKMVATIIWTRNLASREGEKDGKKKEKKQNEKQINLISGRTK